MIPGHTRRIPPCRVCTGMLNEWYKKVRGDFSAEGILSNATQGVLVGALGARGLASQAGQRAVAGQTSTQNAMRALSARLGSGLNVSTPAVSGMLAGQQEVQ